MYTIDEVVTAYKNKSSAETRTNGIEVNYEDVYAHTYEYKTSDRAMREISEFAPEIWCDDDNLRWLRRDFVLYDEDGIKTAYDTFDLSLAEILARTIKESTNWDYDCCERFCRLAGLDRGWEEADEYSFEGVVYKAARKLGVEVV